MRTDDIIKLLLTCSVIVLPALGLTARFALKPIVEAILRLKDGGVLPGDSGSAAEMRQLRAEVQALRHDLGQVRTDVERLQDADSFDRALADPSEPAALPAPQ